jgi:acetamidase/formamidase
MEFDTGRRRFLEIAGTGAALSLAGCNAQQTDGEATGTAGSGATVTVAVQPDQEQLQQREDEIRSQLESGNISQTEAQQQFRTAQSELRAAAVSSFEEQAAESGLTIDDSIEQFSVLLVSGPATALIDALSFEMVNGLLPAETFQQAKEQVTTQTATDTPSN